MVVELITKEKLEKLIRERATIYYVENGVCFEEKLNPNYTHDFSPNHIIWWSLPRKFWLFKNLYKTKEDAEFALKYTNIKRPEILNLPTWEEIQNTHFYEFWNKEFDYMLQYQPVSKKIAVYDRNNRGDYYLQDANEENYIKACDLCVKLFKGEEV